MAGKRCGKAPAVKGKGKAKAIEDSDDDFVDPLGDYHSENQFDVEGGKEDPVDDGDGESDDEDRSGDNDGVDMADFPIVGNRTCPKLLVNAKAKMKPMQRKAVEEIGFGEILNLKAKRFSVAMARWVLENFDARSCELKLGDGRPLHLEAEDAHIMFGFPNGKRSVERKPKRKDCPLLVQWKRKFQSTSIVPK